MTDTLNKTIEELNPTVRTYNCLKRVGIDTVNELVNKTRFELQQIRNMAPKCVEEVEELLKGIGLRLRR